MCAWSTQSQAVSGLLQDTVDPGRVPGPVTDTVTVEEEEVILRTQGERECAVYWYSIQ
jgi:hypothetical protein